MRKARRTKTDEDRVENSKGREVGDDSTDNNTAAAPTADDRARDAIKHWMSMIVDIYTTGGHVDALAYATGEGRMQVQFGSCDAVEEDPAGFLRWLAEGMRPRVRVPEPEATRH
ncbi:MAG: hypothetical protein FJ148_15845 [Deltaproteobacteria bacterium]|nr:hypothetical protein [Deltaproteobacteria bacterium]MBM4269151.1 hypothetical protein [Deltaproteobacteria bacterium]